MAPPVHPVSLRSKRAWETSTPLQVRMALHSGVVEQRNGDYFGLPLSRTARLLVVILL